MATFQCLDRRYLAERERGKRRRNMTLIHTRRHTSS
jgi:hypothetical protein